MANGKAQQWNLKLSVASQLSQADSGIQMYPHQSKREIVMKRIQRSLIGLVVGLCFGTTVCAQSDIAPGGIDFPEVAPATLAESKGAAYPEGDSVVADRANFSAPKSSRGSTVPVPEATVALLCGDRDGCVLRMGMHDWDNSGRVASRESLLYYNRVNRVWRASAGDPAGTDYNGVTEHIMHAWACYFTDGEYKAWKNSGDGNVGFGLLSWNQFNADCWLTIID